MFMLSGAVSYITESPDLDVSVGNVLVSLDNCVNLYICAEG